MRIESSKRWLSRFLIFLALTAVYLYGFPAATLTYVLVDLLHVAVGVLVFLLLLVFLVPLVWNGTVLARLGWILLAAGTLLGVALIKIGTPHHLWNWLYAHIVLCILGVFLLAADWFHSSAAKRNSIYCSTDGVESVRARVRRCSLSVRRGLASHAWPPRR